MRRCRFKLVRPMRHRALVSIVIALAFLIRPPSASAAAPADTTDAGMIAAARAQITADLIHAFVARTHPALAEQLTDYTAMVMIGLSSMARAGLPPARLNAIARTASLALQSMVPDEPRQAAASPRPAVTRAARRRR